MLLGAADKELLCWYVLFSRLPYPAMLLQFYSWLHWSHCGRRCLTGLNCLLWQLIVLPNWVWDPIPSSVIYHCSYWCQLIVFLIIYVRKKKIVKGNCYNISSLYYWPLFDVRKYLLKIKSDLLGTSVLSMTMFADEIAVLTILLSWIMIDVPTINKLMRDGLEVGIMENWKGKTLRAIMILSVQSTKNNVNFVSPAFRMLVL